MVGQAERAGPGQPVPPPTSAARDAVWCGAWNGGRRISRGTGGSVPAIECTAVTSSAAASSSGGRIDGRRWASMVLPAPGRPEQREVVPAGGGELQGEPAALLADHVGQVGPVGSSASSACAAGGGKRHVARG